MKRYLRQILIFVMVFAIAANPLLYAAKADTKAILSDYWDFSKDYWMDEFTKERDWIVDLSASFGHHPTTEEAKVEAVRQAHEKIVESMQNDIGTTTLYNDYVVLPELPLAEAYQANLPYYVIVFDDLKKAYRFFTYWQAPCYSEHRGVVSVKSNHSESLCAMQAEYKSGSSSWTIVEYCPTYIGFEWKKPNASIIYSNIDILHVDKDINLTGGIYYKTSDNKGIITQNLKPLVDAYNSDYGLRSGSNIGDYGYEDGDGQQIIADNIQIVNETEKSIYNPITGDTVTYDNWSYDYSNRSYNVTTSTGDAMTVTYGDEYVTITEGETVYNINYITYVTPEPSEPDTSEPDGNGGNNGNGNGNNNNDNDDSNSLFDVLGELLGSIIKAISDLFTPIIEAFVNAIVAIIGKVLEGLGAFVDMLLRFFLEIPNMFSGFTEFLTAVFPFMPQEFVNLIIFGLMLVIIAAVVKRLVG